MDRLIIIRLINIILGVAVTVLLYISFLLFLVIKAYELLPPGI